MLCFLCGKEIGWPRSLVDQQYCCAEHRKEASLASAQALRDEEEHELWSVLKSNKKKGGAAGASAGQTASLFALLAVAALLVAALMLPGPGTSYSSGSRVALDPGLQRGLVERAGDAIGDAIRGSAQVTLRHDFRTGLSDWITVGLHSASPVDDPRGWSAEAAPELIRPGSLRLWSRSVSLMNYQMEFQGRIENKSLSWAFRATNEGNYYASKILIIKPGPLPNAGLIHYVMMDGHEWDRVQLPLPVTLERGGSYRVRVSVQDDRFITYLNGQVISSWSDKRLHRGGVGFFADEDDPQEVSWVSLSERDSFLGRMLAHFSLIMIPGPVR